MRDKQAELSRREFIKRTSSAAIAVAAGGFPSARAAFAGDHSRHNILMIVTDQER